VRDQPGRGVSVPQALARPSGTETAMATGPTDAEPIAPAARGRGADPHWRMTAATGSALLGALVLSLGTSAPGGRLAAGGVLAGAVAGLVAQLAPPAVQAVRAEGGRVVVAALVLLGALGVAGLLGPVLGDALVALAGAAFLALCGLALIATDLHHRTTQAGARARRSPWQQMTFRARAGVLPWRSAVGAVLAVTAATLVAAVVGTQLASDTTALALLVAGVALVAMAVVALPVVIGLAATADRARLAQARDQERQRVAAHLHDSVLQTLSLVQRQAHDPAAVTRLARQQERALRSWMAGRPEATPDTFAGALHAVAEAVETEEDIDVDVTVLGDGPLDARGEAFVAAAREALRNAARHAPGTTPVVFAEIGPDRAAAWIRDDGPGFDPDAVLDERRGLRDAIVARMAGVGGRAAVETAPGEGTEIALELPLRAGPSRA
jgi:signal transduction histidine kinase